MNYSQTGFALCCGQPPVIQPEKDAPGALGARCATCDKHLGVWGRQVPFLRRHWNKMFQVGQGSVGLRAEHKDLPVPMLFKRNGYISCNVNVNFLRYGSTTKLYVENCLFKCDMTQVDMLYSGDSGYSCVVDTDRHIRDIWLENAAGDQINLQWKDGKRYPYSYVWASTGSWSNNTFEWIINVDSTRVREYKALAAWIGPRED